MLKVAGYPAGHKHSPETRALMSVVHKELENSGWFQKGEMAGKK
jgi:hypothetical protein